MRSVFDFRISIFLSRYGTLILLLLAAAIGLALPVPLAAQGCAMCYTSAAAAKKAGLQALQSGILILGIPPLVMFIGIFWYVFRRRERFNDPIFDGDRGRDDMPSEPTPPLPEGLDEEIAETGSVTSTGRHDPRADSISYPNGR